MQLPAKIVKFRDSLMLKIRDAVLETGKEHELTGAEVDIESYILIMELATMMAACMGCSPEDVAKDFGGAYASAVNKLKIIGELVGPEVVEDAEVTLPTNTVKN